ncbi:MAG: hypothetical protein ACRENS_02025 [Candidatus Eiseniibacteriota bacterium]
MACLMIAEPRRSDADGVEAGVTTSARLDNGTRAEQQGPWWGMALAPELGYSRALPTSSWEALWRGSFDSYLDQGQTHPPTHQATLQASSHGASALESWVDAFYLRSSDPLPSSPSTPFAAGETRTLEGSAGLRAWRGEVSYALEGKAYESPGLTDAYLQTLDGALIPLRGQTDLVKVQATWNDWHMDLPTRLMAATAMLGFERQNTPVLHTSVEAGMVDSRRDDGEPAVQDFAYGASIDGIGRTLGLPFDVRARFRHDVVSTGMAELWRSRPGLRASLKWERRLDVQDGYFSDVALRTFGSLEVRDTVGTGTYLGLEGSAGRARPLSSEHPVVKFSRITATVARRLQPRLTGRLAYSYSWRDEQHGAGTLESFRSRAEVALTAAL